MAYQHFIEGNRLCLRDIQLEDVNDNYHRWMNDHQVTRYLESRFCSYSIEDIREFVLATQNDQDSFMFAMVLQQTGRHIGNIKLGPIDRNHRIADIGLLIGEKDCWGKGYATEAIRLVTDFAFEELDLRKLTAGAYAKNIGSISAFKKAGFAVEGILPKHYILDDAYQDCVCLGLVNEAVKPPTVCQLSP